MRRDHVERIRKIESVQRFHQVSVDVVDLNAASRTRARHRLRDEEQLVHPIVFDVGAALPLAGGPRLLPEVNRCPCCSDPFLFRLGKQCSMRQSTDQLAHVIAATADLSHHAGCMPVCEPVEVLDNDQVGNGAAD